MYSWKLAPSASDVILSSSRQSTLMDGEARLPLGREAVGVLLNDIAEIDRTEFEVAGIPAPIAEGSMTWSSSCSDGW